MKRSIISLPPRLEEMVQELKDEKGYVSTAAVFHAGIIELHSKAFPGYLRKSQSATAPSATDRLKDKRELDKAKVEEAIDSFRAIAEQLGGTVEDQGGKLFCRYFTYTGKKRFEQTVPLEMLSSDLVKTQYQPSRAKVEKLQQEGKCDYAA